MLLISIIAAIVLVLGIGYAAPYLPFNHLLGGGFYQAVSIVLAIVISAVLNMPMLYMLSANSSYKKGEYKKAAEKYKKAYKTKRLSADMEIYCGYILLKEGDRASCEEIFEHLKTKNLTERQKDSFNVNYAILLWKKGETDGAIDLVKKVWEKSPSTTSGGTLGALMLVRAREKGGYDALVPFLEKMNEDYTYEKTIMANLGEAYYAVGRVDDALSIFGELMDCGTTAPAAYYHYALALLEKGECEKAEEMLNRAMRQRFSNLSTVSKKTVRAKLEEITAE